MKALVLSGGGARGAYQVGVLNAIADITADLQINKPFKIYTGVSAGAINAAYLASGCDDFILATKRLTDLWSNLTFEQVFKTDAISLGKIGLKWMGELSLGPLAGNSAGKSLLDTEPLHELLRTNLELNRIQKNIDEGYLEGVGITAVDYHSSKAITFIQGRDTVPSWNRTRRKSETAVLKSDHVMASAAIPILFPVIPVDGRFFGDGCVRNLTPCSPAIRMGAEELFVIGVRKVPAFTEEPVVPASLQSPSVALVINSLLNAILLDGIEADIERIITTNEFIKHLEPKIKEELKLKPLNTVFVAPSQNIGELAGSLAMKLPRIIRYLLKGLGPIDEAKELISYLLFEPAFCVRLIEMGYSDGLAARDNIEKFFKS